MMRFDIIIGNPPYQQSDGGHAASAKPLYHHFVQQAKRLNPKYISLIIPARWYSGGKGLTPFRKEMLHDEQIRVLHDFPDENNCFPHVSIEGGVCYFLWEKDTKGICHVFTHTSEKLYKSKRKLLAPFADTLIRYPKQLSIAEKIWTHSTMNSFASMVSARNPFGLPTDLFKVSQKYDLPPVSSQKINDGLIIYGLDETSHRTKQYVPKDYPFPKGKEHIGKWKVFIPKALGSTMGEDVPAKILGDAFIGSPTALCTETFLNVGNFTTREESEHCLSYIKTKFFRFLAGIIKMTQNTTRQVFQLVPLQDFNEEWTDEKLYAKYRLTAREITFIERKIKAVK